MNSDLTPYSELQLNEQQLEELEKLVAIGFNLTRIARYFKLNLSLVEIEAARTQDADTPGTFYYHYQRGLDFSAATIGMNLLSSAESGNLGAIERLEKIKEANDYEQFKKSVLFG
jgi:hypothetical protein